MADKPAAEPADAHLVERCLDAAEMGGAPQAPAAAAERPYPIHALIERWFADHFHGSAVARDTEAWNVAHAAKEALKKLLVPAPPG